MQFGTVNETPEFLRQQLDLANQKIKQMAEQVLDLTELNNLRVAKNHELLLLDKERVAKIDQMLARIKELGVLARGKELKPLPPVVLVNSLPKSGSQTIVHSLKALGTRLVVHHGHAFSDQGIRNILLWEREVRNEPTSVIQKKATDQWNVFETAKHAINGRQDILTGTALADGNPAFFISGIREPVDYFLSLLFQLEAVRDYSNSKEGELSIEYIHNKLHDYYFVKDDTTDFLPKPETWMQRELVDFLGLDPFKSGFDKEKGYQIYKTNLGNLLLFRVEDLSRVFNRALSDLLGPLADGVERVDSNVGKQKHYSADYEWVRQNFKVSPDLLDKIYASRYVRTFYSEAEIAKFKARWVA